MTAVWRMLPMMLLASAAVTKSPWWCSGYVLLALALLWLDEIDKAKRL